MTSPRIQAPVTLFSFQGQGEAISLSAVEPSGSVIPVTPLVDFEAMSILHQACFPYEGWSAASLKASCTDIHGIGTVAFDATTGQLVGFLICRFVLDEAEIITLAVSPQAQRQGIARKLWSYCRPALEAQGVTLVLLEVAVSNTPARSLYQDVGFTPYALRKGYYTTLTPDGQKATEDAEAYRLSL